MLWWVRELGVRGALLEDCSFGPVEAGHVVRELVPAPI